MTVSQFCVESVHPQSPRKTRTSVSQPVCYRIEAQIEGTRRFLAVRSAMGWTPEKMLWTLHRLWAHARLEAPDGVLERYSPLMLAAACDVSALEATSWHDSMVEAGFLEDSDGALIIPDWIDTNGQLLADSGRKRLARSLRSSTTAFGLGDASTSENLQEKDDLSRGQSADGPGTVRGSSEDRPRTLVLELADSEPAEPRGWEAHFEAFWQAWPVGHGDGMVKLLPSALQLRTFSPSQMELPSMHDEPRQSPAPTH